MWSMSGSREFFMSHGISTRSEPIPLVKKRKETSSLSWTSVQTRKNPTPPHSGCPFSFPVFWGKSSPWKPKLAKFIQISQLVVLGTCSSYRFSAGLVEQRSPTKGFGERRAIWEGLQLPTEHQWAHWERRHHACSKWKFSKLQLYSWPDNPALDNKELWEL